jgi:beta-glucosidase
MEYTERQIMQKKSPFNFPTDFLWGTATSAHQVEGNNYNQWTRWEKDNARLQAAKAQQRLGYLPTWSKIEQLASDPSNYISGNLADHYNQYKRDFDLLDKMHMNAYRFSVEWSRIEPEEGQWNTDAIKYYRRYVSELKRRQIQPIMTLFHFTLPVWFEDRGGFEKRANIKYFVRFAQKIVRELISDVQFIITINEPEVYTQASYFEKDWPPAKDSFSNGQRVIKNLILAHNQTAKTLHKLNCHLKVSIAKNSKYFYAGNNTLLSRFNVLKLQSKDDYVIKRTIKQCDFLGVNYYMSDRVYGFKIRNPNQPISDLGWDMQPANLQFVLERLYRKYHKPIIVTENGLADATDKHRQWWLTRTLIAMQKAMDNGVELEGYLHWSLIDNFEWAYGKWPRFGLAAVDYKTGRRTLRPSARWFGRVIKQLRGV